LYDYGARFYDPALGRFISADTVVPNPGNPQALNRYSYCYNNPLRYVDPTGHYSEDEIMKHFGVSTWKEVLAIFEKNGLWGWLAALRAAKNGEALYFFTGRGSVEDQQGSLYGYWTIKDGKIGLTDVPGGDTFCSADEAMVLAAASTWIGVQDEAQDPFPLPAQNLHKAAGTLLAVFEPKTQYYWWRFRPERVDWVGVVLDGGGIVLDVFTGGVGGRFANVAGVAWRGAKIISKVDLARSLMTTDLKSLAAGTGSIWDVIALGTDVAGLAPAPYGTAADVAGLGVNFINAGGMQWTP